MPLAIANLATSIPRDNLLSAGTQMGKFTKTGKFRLNLTCLDVVAPHARYKVFFCALAEARHLLIFDSCGSNPMEKCLSSMEVTL